MTFTRLVFRSLCYHARAHLGAFLGAAIGGAVLIGALVVGDSVRATLRGQALLRLGKVEVAMASGDRLFRGQLAAELQAGLTQAGVGQPSFVPVVPALQLPAVVTTGDGAGRANHAQVLGVDARFWGLSEFARLAEASRRCPLCSVPLDKACEHQRQHLLLLQLNVPADSVILNRPLAEQLHVKLGDEIVLRVQKPAQLSRDAPLSPEENTTVALRLTVCSILPDLYLGRFSLQANQAAPLNAFVPLALLQARAGALDRANLLLVGQPPPPPQQFVAPFGFAPVRNPAPDLWPVVTNLFRKRWQLEDAELEWRELPDAQAWELRTRRVFLDAPIAEAVQGLPVGPRLTPGQARPSAPRPMPVPGQPVTPATTPPPPAPLLPKPTGSGVLTYLVNELRLGDRATPYSMVAAIEPPLAPADLRDDEILVTQWLAEDLAAKPGDELSLTYYVVGLQRELEERSARFRVRAVIPMDWPGLDRGLMPDFPGLAAARSCREWDTGLPIKTERIREKDEEYWRAFQGTPKALVTLAAGRNLWRNRFGELTAVRFHRAGGALPPGAAAPSPNARLDLMRTSINYRAALTQALLSRLDPASLGLSFQPVRAQALAAVAQAQDFGQLFLGFSFFLIVAALLLTSVLFQFGMEQRATELGTLLALGFSPRQAGRLFLGEAGLLALLGGSMGAWASTWYAQVMLRGLATVWRDAIGGVILTYHVERATVCLGLGASFLVTWIALWLAFRRQARLPAHTLLAEGGVERDSALITGSGARRRRWALGVLALISAAGLTGWALWRKETAAAGLFFGAGALLLAGGVALCSAGLQALGGSAVARRLSLTGLGVRGAARRPKRSLAVVALLACGAFLIASIGVFRLEAVRGADQRSSGTGGFALIGEATQPVTQDLNSPKGREAYALDAATLTGVHVVPCRVRDGDEASCLNLNRAQAPRLLGVRPESLQERGAFTFAQVAAGLPKDKPWLLLNSHTPDGTVPAIADQASILWALGKKVGDTIPYTDERGRLFQLRLVGAVANSLLQGNLIISEGEFLARFPSASGYRFFLIDAPPPAVEKVSAALTRGLKDLGFEVTPAVARLAAFNAVQNTYLGTFQLLGGLGLVLGSAGLGVVVLRNVLERRGELALLLAVGFRRGALCRLVLSEHGALLLAGLALGIMAALVAVLPSALSPGAALPYLSLGLTLGGVFVNGALWTWLATQAALRGKLLDALRNE